jgi:hypothetical protein
LPLCNIILGTLKALSNSLKRDILPGSFGKPMSRGMNHHCLFSLEKLMVRFSISKKQMERTRITKRDM